MNALTLLTGRPALLRNLYGLGGTDFGGIWVLTDLATARALGLTPVQIENATGQFVAPTPESLQAAVPTLQETSAGALIPTPDDTASAGSAYPLTYVEYAWAPTYPLYDETCTARTSSEALLTDWLTFATGSGQDLLPEGFVPLTPDLQAKAAAAIPQIGQTPRPDGCDPSSPNGPAAPIPVPPPPAAPSATGAAVASKSAPPTSRSAAAASAGVGDSAATIELASSDVPSFFGAGAVGKLLALLALLLLAGATSAAVVYGSRWSGVTPAEGDEEILATVEEP